MPDIRSIDALTGCYNKDVPSTYNIPRHPQGVDQNIEKLLAFGRVLTVDCTIEQRIREEFADNRRLTWLK